MTSEVTLIKITTRLYDGDRETLQKFYSQAGYQRAIREIIHTHTKQLEAELESRNLETTNATPKVKLTFDPTASE